MNETKLTLKKFGIGKGVSVCETRDDWVLIFVKTKNNEVIECVLSS